MSNKNHKKKPLPAFMLKERKRQQEQREKKFRREMNSFTQSFGRDGAYMEIEMKDVFDTLTSSESLPKMVTLKNNRLEVSDREDICNLKKIFKAISESPESEGMNGEQIGFYAFRMIFKKGMDEYIKTIYS